MQSCLIELRHLEIIHVILSAAKDLTRRTPRSFAALRACCMSYQHRSHRESLALPLEAYSPPAWWSTMYVNSSGHEVGNPYTCPERSEGMTCRTQLEVAHGKSSLQMSR